MQHADPAAGYIYLPYRQRSPELIREQVSRAIPEGIRRFGTWARLLLPFYIPRDADGRLNPARGEVETLFDGSAGIVRHPVADFEAQTIYFAYRPDKPEVQGWQS